MKTGQTLNAKFNGATLYEIEFTPRGGSEKILISVWAKNRLDASSFLILNEIYGIQHAIRIHTSNLLK